MTTAKEIIIVIRFQFSPSTNCWTIQIPDYIHRELELVLYDINGRRLSTFMLRDMPNSNFPLSAENYAEGMYLLQIRDLTTGAVLSLKLVKD